MKRRASASSTHKKVMVTCLDRSPAVRGYLNPGMLGHGDTLDLLTPEGEHESLSMAKVKCVHFVREFTENFDLERKAFFTRPKLEGLWVRLSFRDGDTVEGLVANDLLELLQNGIQFTPPDMQGNTFRMFVPRAALAEMKVLGVVGAARQIPARPRIAVVPQRKLFEE